MFGAGAGGFGTSGTGFGTSTPFGSTTGQPQTSAFGASGTGFGANTTNAFGAKPTFGSTAAGTAGGFGATSTAFGAKPNVFGAPAAAAPATTFGAPAAGTSAFGRTTSTSPFGAGAGAAPATGAFGSTTGAFGATAAAPANPFGAPAATAAGGLGGFGSTATTGAFGKPATNPFGTAAAGGGTAGSVFGAAAPAPAVGAFGGFGAAAPGTTTGGLFGSTTAPATGAFGAPAATTAGATGGLFGAAAPVSAFGAGGGAAKFGAPAQPQQGVGTGNPPWRETRAEDPTGKAGTNPGMLMSISAMKEYEGKSHEELRVEDYLQNRKNSSAVTAAAPAAGLFGGFGATPAPAPATAFSFGNMSTSTTPAPSAFGGTFGAAAPAPATGAFGFGASAAPAPTTSLFGAPAPATGAFGAPAAAAPAASGFGGLFGSAAAPAAATPAFGAPAAPAPASTGMFGSFGGLGAAAAPATGAFGSTTGGFGAPAAATASAPAPFSFAAGAFGTAAPAPAASSAFGAATPGLFGTAPAAATSAPGAFSFGTKPAAAATAPAGTFSFGGTTGAFGAAAKPATSAFGAPAAAAGGLFGSAASPAPATGGFNFGGAAAPAPATTAGGGFGGFGGAFGAAAPAPATTSAFGAPATGGLFGTPAAAAPAAGGLFGASAQQQQQQQLQQQQLQQQQLQQQQRVAVHNQDPYGAGSNAGFGSGALEQKIKGVENSSQQLAISFERNNAHPSSSGVGSGGDHGGGGGAGSPSLGFAYRRTPRSKAFIQPRGLGGGGGVSAAGGKSGAGGGGGGGGYGGNTGGGGGGEGVMPPPATSSSSSRLLSEGALTPAGKSGVLSPDVYLSGGVKRLNIPPDTEERRQRFSSARPLIKGSTPAISAGSGPTGRRSGAGGGAGGGAEEATGGRIGADNNSANFNNNGNSNNNSDGNSSGNGNINLSGGSGGGGGGEDPSGGGGGGGGGATDSANLNGTGGGSDGARLISPSGSARRPPHGGGLASPPPSSGVGTDVRAAAGGGDDSLLDESPVNTGGGGGGSGGGGGGGGNAGRLFAEGLDGGGGGFAPRLDVEGYDTRPSMSELAAMGERSLRRVSGFVVSRQGFGSIAWKEPVDLRGVDIGKAVVIEHKSASVYDDVADGEKPGVGEGLNQPAKVTLYDIFPKKSDPSEQEKRLYEGRVRKNTEKIGAKLVDYDVETGVWVFETYHWSRYAMDDSDDEGDDASSGGGNKQNGNTASAKLMPPPPAPGLAGRVPRVRAPTPARGLRPSGSMHRRSTKYSMPDTDDEGSVADNASDAGGAAGVNVRGSDEGFKPDSSKSEGSGGPDADADAGNASADADAPAPEEDGAGEGDDWADSRRCDTNRLFPERDSSRPGHMRSSLFENEGGFASGAGSVKALRSSGGSGRYALGGADLGEGEGGGARPFIPHFTAAASGAAAASLSWAPPPPALKTRPPPLGNREDAEAAARFRPAVPGPQSHTLRSLANAWEPAPGEVADAGTRGAVRAGWAAADLGLRMGRGFRASWGPGGKLVCPDVIGGGGGGGREGGETGCHTVRVLRFDPTPVASGRDLEELYVSPLRNHFHFAQQTNEAEDPAAIAKATANADAGTEADKEVFPPRWALPRRRSDRPENYASLVRCMHGYANVHASAATGTSSERAAGLDFGGRKTPEDSPEWVLEQSWRLASAMWGQEEGEGRAQDLPIPGEEAAVAAAAAVAASASGYGRDGCGGGGGGGGASAGDRREAAVGEWLADAVASCVSADEPFSVSAGGGLGGGGDGGDVGQGAWKRVLELLSVRRVQEAAGAAMAAGLPRLAVVLTAAVATWGSGGGGDGDGSAGRGASCFLAQQASLWQGAGADARMPQEAFTVYQLLGREGFRDVHLRGVIGKGSDSRRPSLDWLRQFGLCLWFGAAAPPGGVGGGSAVAEAVRAYECLVAENEALSPIARYFREPTHHFKADVESAGEELRRALLANGRSLDGGSGLGPASGRDRCVLSCMLAMYPFRSAGGGGGGGGGRGGGSSSGAALLAALEPLSVTPDAMDYRHSWHLMNIVEALGVAEVPDRAKAAAVAEGLRFQLVSAGLWQWAVYVALTVEGDPVRRAAPARELVLRHGYGLLEAPIGSADAARHDLLIRAGVPVAWMHEAAAVRAGYEHKSALQTPTQCTRGVDLAMAIAVGRSSGGGAEEVRESKLKLLVSAESEELARDAAREACALAPSSLYLGGAARSRLANHFRDVARQLGSSGGREFQTPSGGVAGGEIIYGARGGGIGGGMGGMGGGGAGDADLLSKVFDAYKEILEAAEEGPMAGGSGDSWSREEVERLERMRRVVLPSAARAVGPAAAHEALNTLWREASISVG